MENIEEKAEAIVEVASEATNETAEAAESKTDVENKDSEAKAEETADNLSEAEHKENLKKKKAIIAQMVELMKGDDYGKFSQQFRDLMTQWKETGNVAESDAHDINSQYKQVTDKFFEISRLNREMRELDHKRNYEAKIKLCEQAEELANSPSATKSFNQIQALHAQWKQIGGVSQEVREELWNRFKAATTVVNERFHKYVDESKDREKANYEAKLGLIAEVEAILKEDLSTGKAIDAAAKKVNELQEKWRTIGIVPKAVNNEVYANFRKVCDEIYNKRRAFYKNQTSILKANLEQKNKLIEQAEALKDSTNWKETFDKLVAIQKKWKTIGPVPHKVSDEVWKKFKSTCDYFFEQRDKAMGTEDAAREKNHELKSAILEELKAATLPTESEDLFKTVQEFQQRWNQVGPLPSKKREIHQEFMDLVNKLYDKCASDDASKNLQRFKAKMELLKDSADGQSKINTERNRLIQKIKQLESEVTTLENNIGFFSKSKNSDALKNDFENKIKTAKRNIDQANEKLDIIDAL